MKYYNKFGATLKPTCVSTVYSVLPPSYVIKSQAYYSDGVRTYDLAILEQCLTNQTTEIAR